MAVIKGDASGGGVEHGELLVKFAEAILGGTDAELDAVRSRLCAETSPAAMVDAAAVAALFNAIDRVADSTGIPVEPEKLKASADYKERLGIRKYRED